MAAIDLRFTTAHPYATLFVVSLLVYSNAPRCEFVFDDVSAIKDNRDLRPATPWMDLMFNDFWGTPMDAERSHKSYRPLTVASFRLNYHVDGLRPRGYHVLNVFLHCCVCLLLFKVLLSTVCLQTPGVAFLSACLFALHPIHAEAVTGVVGRAELLASLFYLAAFYTYHRLSEEPHGGRSEQRARQTTTAVTRTTTTTSSSSRPAVKSRVLVTWAYHLLFSLFLILAMLSKEQGITVAGLCVLFELLIRLDFNLKTAPWFSSRLCRSSPDPNSSSRSRSSISPTSSAVNGDGDGNSTTGDDVVSSLIGAKRDLRSMLNTQSLTIIFHAVTFTLSLLWFRFEIMGEGPPVFTAFDNPASTSAAPARQLTYNYLLPVNAWLLLCPSGLCCDWTMGTVPLVVNGSDPRNLATFAFYVLYSSLAFRVAWPTFPVASLDLHYPAIVFGFLTLTLPFLPASNLLFPVGFVVAERVLYLPSMGFAVLVAVGAHKIHHTLTRRLVPKETNQTRDATTAPESKGVFGRAIIVPFLCFFLLHAHALKLYSRNADWIDEKTLFLSGLKITRDNAKLFNNVGHALEGEKDFGAALTFFERAVRAQPDDIGAHMNVGRTYNTLGNMTAAEAAFWKAKSLLPAAKRKRRKKKGGAESTNDGADGDASYVTRIAPQHLKIFVNLGNIMAKDPSRFEEADRLYQEAIRMRSDFKEAYINRGDILFKLNRVEEALAMYEDALRIDPRDSDVYFNIGVIRLEKFDDKQASFKLFEKALELNPDHALALFNTAVMMQESGNPQLRLEAERRLLKILQQKFSREESPSSTTSSTFQSTEPPEEKIHFNLGMLAMDAKNDSLAEVYFRHAISLKPDFRSALFNLALMLTSSAEAKAESVAKEGGAAATKDLFLPAIEAAEDLLHHHPKHAKALVLMGDLQINRMKNLSYAEHCFSRAFELDPTNNEALHNLCVVHVERGLLDEAKTCLERVLTIAPKVDYVKTHLNIVNSRIAKRNLARKVGKGRD